VTWVIGMSGHLIGAVLVADVRVSFPSGQRDTLRKIHPVAPNIAIGFAGSVAIGFDMVESLEASPFETGPSRR
jgi:20S proteasome alpha/beta subunit